MNNTFCVNVPKSAQSSELVKAVLRLRIVATSMPKYVSGWCGHGFVSHSQPFLLTYSEADLNLWAACLTV